MAARTSDAPTSWTPPVTATRDAVLPDGTDRDLRRLIYGIFTVSVRFDRLREAMADCVGLTGIQYHILMVVAEIGASEGGAAVTVSTVADVLHASGAYVTTESGKLVARGLLEKHRNPADGRSVVLAPTAAGRALIDGFAPDQQAVNDTLFDGVGPETFEKFLAIIEHMVGTSGEAVEMIERLARQRRGGATQTNGADATAIAR